MQIENRQKMLTLVALVAVGLFLGDKVIFTPLVSAWKTRATRIAQLRTQIRDGKLLVQREPGIRSRWQDMQANTLTNNTSAAEQQFFRSTDSWAQDSRVTINALTPQWKRDADDYATYQCRIDASGNLGALSKFLYDLERDPMAIKLESVEIAARDKLGQQLSLGLQISGLVLNPQTR